FAIVKARRTSSRLAFGTVPISCSVYGLKTSMTRSRWTLSPPIRIASRRSSLAFMGAPGEGSGSGRFGDADEVLAAHAVERLRDHALRFGRVDAVALEARADAEALKKVGEEARRVGERHVEHASQHRIAAAIGAERALEHQRQGERAGDAV